MPHFQSMCVKLRKTPSCFSSSVGIIATDFPTRVSGSPDDTGRATTRWPWLWTLSVSFIVLAVSQGSACRGVIPSPFSWFRPETADIVGCNGKSGMSSLVSISFAIWEPQRWVLREWKWNLRFKPSRAKPSGCENHERRETEISFPVTTFAVYKYNVMAVQMRRKRPVLALRPKG